MIRECLVCGKEFEACNTCLKGVPENLQWRRVVCCREHFAYHMPIILYVRKVMSKDEAKKELQEAIDNFGNVDFCSNIKDVVDEILADERLEKSKIADRNSKKNKTGSVEESTE